MYKYYNANPRGISTDDCVKRAISVAAGMNYNDVQRMLNRHKKITGAQKFNSDRNPHHFVETVLRATQLDLSALGGAMSCHTFCQSHPKGRYILDLSEHWSCAIDGVIYDTWDCSALPIVAVYKITAPFDRHILRYCCTVRQISATEAVVCIYDGNGICAKRSVPAWLCDGYVRCLEDMGYPYVNF